MSEDPIQNKKSNNSNELEGTESQTTPTHNSELDPIKLKLEEAEKKYLYLYSEFETYKRRAQKEVGELLKFAHEPLARDLLGVLDNFKRALAAPSGAENALRDGIGLVFKELSTILAKRGIEKIEAEGKAFNPEFHEAVGEVPSDLTPGLIAQVENDGYLIHSRLLRPARVLISRKS